MTTPPTPPTQQEDLMSPTDGHLRHASRESMRGQRHIQRRPRHARVSRHPNHLSRHSRLTLAESPELYMREEMI
jgi:hypothetical protein